MNAPRCLLIALSSVLLAACASAPTVAPDPTVQELDHAAQKVVRLLTTIAASERSATPTPPVHAIPTTGVLATPVSLQWYGPMTGAVRAVAVLIGYRFEQTGAPPATPILVAVNRQSAPAYAVLETIGWQAGARADVIVRPDAHLVKIVYVGPPQ